MLWWLGYVQSEVLRIALSLVRKSTHGTALPHSHVA